VIVYQLYSKKTKSLSNIMKAEDLLNITQFQQFVMNHFVFEFRQILLFQRFFESIELIMKNFEIIKRVIH